MYGEYYLESIRHAFVAQQWNQVFTGNRTRLKVVGLDRMPPIRIEVERSAGFLLPNVSCFDMSFTPSPQAETQETSRRFNIMAFEIMFPNLEEVDVSSSRTSNTLLFCILFACRKIRRIKCNASRDQIDMAGVTLVSISDSLTELYLDNSQLISLIPGNVEVFSVNVDEDQENLYFLLKRCGSLERLSIKNASWSTRDGKEQGDVSQEMLIKMVRNHPALRWLRSDLTKENIAVLQRERPDITFVSD